ncbi:MAG: hypothetical protein NZ926_02735, partial [Candidatus Methanomethylicia archaeon]|nr:hypothetical protein [Candidatus Methanomethylicia archaeon]
MVQITENDIVILGMSYPDFVKTYGEEMAKKRLRQLYGTDDIKQAIEIEKKRREEYLKQLEEESKKRYEALAKPAEKKITVEEARGYLVGDELKTKTYTYDIIVKPSGEIILPEGISEDVKAYIEKTVKDATKKNINLTKIKLGSGFLSRYGEYGVVGWAEGNKVLPSGRLVFVEDADSGKLTDMFVVDATHRVHDLDVETKNEIIKVLRSSKIPEGSVLEIRNNELVASKWQIMEIGNITEEFKKGVSINLSDAYYVREEKSTNPIRYIPFIGGIYDIFVAVKGEEPVTVKKYLCHKEMLLPGTKTAIPETLIEDKTYFEKIETPERVLRGVIGAADVITSALLIKTGISYALKKMEKPLTLKMSQYSIQNEGKALVETRYFLNNKFVTEIGKATVEEAAEKTALINYQPLLRTTLEKTKLGFIRQTDEFLKDEFSKIGVKKLIEGVESKKELNLIKANIETPDEYLKISAFSIKQETRGFEIGTVVSGTRELETAGLYKVIKTGKGRLTLITPEGLQEYQAESLAYISRSIGKAG